MDRTLSVVPERPFNSSSSCENVAEERVLPQVTFALIGGFLIRKYRITITPRV